MSNFKLLIIRDKKAIKVLKYVRLPVIFVYELIHVSLSIDFTFSYRNNLDN
jgi:hypothetical protein